MLEFMRGGGGPVPSLTQCHVDEEISPSQLENKPSLTKAVRWGLRHVRAATALEHP